MNLLFLSNGHGEDAIAVRILKQLPWAKQNEPLSISALPLSGEGTAYQQAEIELIGPAQALPSGGFLYQDGRQLLRDLRGGLIVLAWQQFVALRNWAKTGGAVIAVGDVVPLLLAWLSGLPYAFVGTAKSEYWLRDGAGKLPAEGVWSRFSGWSGSVYLPWERWLMRRPLCQAVFVRDALTADWLQQRSIPAIYVGNPMMDGLGPTAAEPLIPEWDNPFADRPIGTEPLTLLLLPGSRAPEAYQNWEQILATVPGLVQAFHRRPLTLLAAIAPSLALTKFQNPLSGWQPLATEPYAIFRDRNVTLALIPDAYATCLEQAVAAIAMAGTATEQFVGLGKPALTLPGLGPQFTHRFAQVQARMLGPAVTLVEHPSKVGAELRALLDDPDRLRLADESGRQRMGTAGGSQRIAQQLAEQFSKLV
ncbi:hypothetical protein IQ241_16495 [Romeria aff. gracilis LEGE 07310]|uniref:Lipid-A-disaccharide synthase n=1 Tax=Vasconcelosia minhoensis LEGE 07310 TaxID=915328 RepID=A0A8J7A866_9CYAN|nr:lipid-A-disaccharide synthase-related protein [Romeria gracilis]MBE9078872.1 hypothetical protein [Romeria aff. gracilis LEGE 07310]